MLVCVIVCQPVRVRQADSIDPLIAHQSPLPPAPNTNHPVSCNLRSGNLARLVQHTIHCLNLALEGDIRASTSAAATAATAAAADPVLSPPTMLRIPQTPLSSGSSASAAAPGKAPAPPGAADAAGGEGGDFFMLEAMNGMRLTAVFVGTSSPLLRARMRWARPPRSMTD